MTWTSRSLTVAGLLILAHACYSAQEHIASSSTLAKNIVSGRKQQPTSSLPLDICVETMAATLITCLGLVLGFPKMRPIQWHIWAGTIEREGDIGCLDASGEIDAEYCGNPFEVLESRPGFANIRKQRREVTEWVEGAIAAVVDEVKGISRLDKGSEVVLFPGIVIDQTWRC